MQFYTSIYRPRAAQETIERKRSTPQYNPSYTALNVIGYTALNIINALQNNALQNKLSLDFRGFFDYLEQLPPITEDEEEEELSPRVIEKLEAYSKVVIDGEQIILFVKEKETSTFTIHSQFFFIMAQALTEKTGKNYFITLRWKCGTPEDREKTTLLMQVIYVMKVKCQTRGPLFGWS